MPLKLIPPRLGKTPYFSIRGTHHGVYLDRSTKSPDKSSAAKFLKAWKEDIERNALARPGEPTFIDAVVNYIAHGGEDEYLEKISEKIAAKPLRLIDQRFIDETAITLHPSASAATRNRNFYTPVSAVLKHAGFDWKIRRPKGWRGKEVTRWMEPEQAFRLIKAACAEDLEFGIFLMALLYCGGRLSETAAITCDQLNLSQAFAYMGRTKNGQPRAVHLPPVLVSALASHPKGLDRRHKISGRSEKVFRFRKNGRVYNLLRKAKKAAGADLSWVSFHSFRHTWGAWMRRYGNLDTSGLVATGAWLDAASARRYEHAVASEEARKANQLPVEKAWTDGFRLAIGHKNKG